jgi:ribonucleoside-diphosphate reductase alpha chain
MSVRERLPDRRASTSITFEVNGLVYVATYSQFPDGGDVGEIFLRNHRVGSHADIAANDAAVAASLALQFGCPLETLQQALGRDSRGGAAGPLGHAVDLIQDAQHDSKGIVVPDAEGDSSPGGR